MGYPNLRIALLTKYYLFITLSCFLWPQVIVVAVRYVVVDKYVHFIFIFGELG